MFEHGVITANVLDFSVNRLYKKVAIRGQTSLFVLCGKSGDETSSIPGHKEGRNAAGLDRLFAHASESPRITKNLVIVNCIIKYSSATLTKRFVVSDVYSVHTHTPLPHHFIPQSWSAVAITTDKVYYNLVHSPFS